MGYEKWAEMPGNKVPSTTGFSNKIFEYISEGSRVLDLGCGYGRLSRVLSSKGYRVYGVDINKSAIKEARKNASLDEVNLCVQSATDLGFPERFFEGIISQAVLACMDLESRKKSLHECYRVLDKNGILQLVEFGLKNGPDSYTKDAKVTGEYGTVIVRNNDGSEKFRTHNFDKKELEALLIDAGFELENYEPSIFTTINGNLHPGHIFLLRKN